MSNWWYAKKRKEIGPVTLADLSRLLESGTISRHTMVWTEGMEEWQPLKEIEALDELRNRIPPPLPERMSESALNYPLADRWPRFFARIFDLWWEVLSVSLALGYTLGTYSAGFVRWISTPGSEQLFGILCIPIAFALDALVYRILGNTPGKALLGLKVTSIRGTPLRFGQYLLRNLSLWMRGLAFGLPLVNLVTLVYQFRRLGNGQQASYDEATGFRVHAQPCGWFRKVVFVAAFAGVFALLMLVNIMGQSVPHETLLSGDKATYLWRNPLTNVSTPIDSKWKQSTQKTEDGLVIYLFSEHLDRAMVILGAEKAAGYTLDEYIHAFQQHNAENMQFSDRGRITTKNGRNTWSANGNMAGIGANRLSVQIVESDSTFWRIVAVQARPYDYSESLVDELRSALWSTVN